MKVREVFCSFLHEFCRPHSQQTKRSNLKLTINSTTVTAKFLVHFRSSKDISTHHSVMFMSMLSLSVLFASAIGTHAACANNETYSAIWDSKSYTCSKLRMDNNRGPRFNLCKAVETRIACPHSCGTCCEDDPLFKFGQKSNDKQQGCDWILKSLKNEIDVYRQTEYCNGYWDNGAAIRAKCQVSCDFCFGTQAPTPAPTISDDGTYHASII